MQADESNFLKNELKWTLGKQSKASKLDDNCKLSPLLKRRSYNVHMGSDNFINLLDESPSSEQSNVTQNIKSLPNAVSHGKELLNTNEQRSRCLPSKQLLQKSAGKILGLKVSSPDKMSVEAASQSEFASQTLKPFSMQHLEWIQFDDSYEIRNGNTNYKLKETSPGCLPSKKGKSKRLQRKSSSKMEQEFNPESLKNSKNDKETENAQVSEENKKVRRKSFINSVIKFAKFGRRKKPPQEAQETSEDSNWATESSEETQEREDESLCQEDEFIFGGVRVFFDENGEFCETDNDHYDTRSVATFSEDESVFDDPPRRSRTKFESSDSLNLGYSGSFVA